MARWLIIGAVALAVVIAVVVWRAEGPSTPEEQVRAMVRALVEAAEARDVSAMASHVSETYRDARGLDKDQIRTYVAGLLMRSRWAEVIVTDSTVFVDGETATVRLGAVLARRRETPVPLDPGLAVGAQRIELRLMREGDDWLVTWSDHQRADPAALLDALGAT